MNRFCWSCGKEINQEGEFCLNCGAKIKNQTVQNSHKNGLPIWAIVMIVVLGVIVFFGIVGSILEDNTDSNHPGTDSGSTVPGSSTKEPENEDFSNVALTYELTSGHYTAGIDLPSGKCNVIAISGDGNVSSSNIFDGGINEMMGVSASEYYSQSFNGLKMDKGVVLSVSNGVTIRLEYTSITSNYTGRIAYEENAITLSNGNYSVGSGQDIPAGVYNIIAISGNGNVSSSNIFDGGINAMMGVTNSNYYEKEYKNITLEKNGNLTISNGVTVKLIPVSN